MKKPYKGHLNEELIDLIEVVADLAEEKAYMDQPGNRDTYVEMSRELSAAKKALYDYFERFWERVE